MQQPTGEVTVYWLSVPDAATVQDVAGRLGILTAEERHVYDRYRVDFKKIEFLAGRLLLRTVLQKWIDVEANQIEFVKNDYGKLFFAEETKARAARHVSFNLSHAGRMICCVVAPDFEAGVDVEEVRDQHLSVMPSVFTNEEIAFVEAMPAEQRPQGFYLIWTRKEAYVKAVGKGLSIPPNTFSVPLEPGTCRQGSWEYRTFAPNAGYLISTAFDVADGEAEPRYAAEEVRFADLFGR